MRGRTLAVVLVAASLVACTDDAGEGAEGLSATPDVVERPTSSSEEPSTDPAASDGTPSDEPSSEEPSPSPEPTPTPTPGPEPTSEEETAVDLDEDAALAAAVERRASRDECGDGGIEDDVHHVVAERAGALLVYVACFVGAYQANGELLAFDGELTSWPVEQWVDGAVTETAEVTGDVIEAPDGSLENLQRYRGLGDCGLYQRWEVVERRLVLREAREQQCDTGAEPVPTAEWPLVHGG